LLVTAEAIRVLGKRVVRDVIEIGARLWLPWLDREFGWTDKTAERFMRVHSLAGQKPQLVEFDFADQRALHARRAIDAGTDRAELYPRA
jgi:hypothetical protein